MGAYYCAPNQVVIVDHIDRIEHVVYVRCLQKSLRSTENTAICISMSVYRSGIYRLEKYNKDAFSLNCIRQCGFDRLARKDRTQPEQTKQAKRKFNKLKK